MRPRLTGIIVSADGVWQGLFCCCFLSCSASLSLLIVAGCDRDQTTCATVLAELRDLFEIMETISKRLAALECDRSDKTPSAWLWRRCFASRKVRP